MNPRFKLVLVLVALAVALSYSAWQNENGRPVEGAQKNLAAGNFDFYVLALSWSPTFCAEQGDNDDKEQCGLAKPFAFVVHGLWPQNERGWPEFCDSSYPSQINNRLARRIFDQIAEMMPSRGLMFHQWRKHGTCSGLSPEDYFALTREARSKVKVPDQFKTLADYRTVSPNEIERAFIGANAKLQQNGIAVTCSNRYLKEVRICMDKGLNLRPCPEIDGNSCRAKATIMPPVRR